ncbi:MFS transporter [Chenggangzhangella methanolivorans]|uniref:MFS transporter n=1 Tax=Chenggangzhangella methanolivorans TaxID=1437009 RepID=A0A9E6UN63_9HYPH|nr:MFS transporter [Chenggangzhangella methanolivorans]QZO00706.1 MFS transporter [Chenggangzhangella methanolivorans]
MLTAYGEIFQAPGAKGFAAAGFVARLPVAMAPIGIVTMLSQTHGAYWLAGAVAATFALANALIAPQISRLVDKAGQTPVVAPATVVSVAAFAMLVAAAHFRWPVWTLFAASLFAAAMPSVPALVRARWTALFRDRPALATAFAFESAADELVYIAGASLSVAISVALFPEAGVAVAAVMLALGVTALLLQRSTEPRPAPVRGGRSTSAIRLQSVQVVTLILIFMGVIFAATEVGVVALTKAFGAPGAASAVIGVYAVGSFVVGVALGAARPEMALHRQIVLATAIVALTQPPLLFAGGVAQLAVFVFLSGVAVSPTFITAFGIVAGRVPAHMLTEGVTWVMTGLGVGMASGAFLGGWAIDLWGSHGAFAVSTFGGLAAVLTTALGRRILAEDDRPSAAGAAQCAA